MLKSVILCALIVAGMTMQPVLNPMPKEYIIDDVLETLKGIFHSWNASHEDVQNLLECAKDLIDVEGQVIKILNEIKEVDVTNIIKLVECIIRLFGCFQRIFKDMIPCVKSYDDINKLVHKIIDLTPIEMLQKLMLNIMDNARKIYKDILSLIKALKANNFYQFGYLIGDILELLFLREPDP